MRDTFHCPLPNTMSNIINVIILLLFKVFWDSEVSTATMSWTAKKLEFESQ